MSEEAITDYFNLGVDLETLYTQWSKVTNNSIKINRGGGSSDTFE